MFISDSTGADSAIPEPAASLVQTLAVANLDIAGFVPTGCVFRNANTYDVFSVQDHFSIGYRGAHVDLSSVVLSKKQFSPSGMAKRGALFGPLA